MKLFVTVLVEGEYMPKILKKLSENKKSTSFLEVDLKSAIFNLYQKVAIFHLLNLRILNNIP